MLTRVVFGLRISWGKGRLILLLIFGRRHQSELLMDAWRCLLEARTHWYLVMQQLHRFMIAVSRLAVNHDGKGGSAPDPLVWGPWGNLEGT